MQQFKSVAAFFTAFLTTRDAADNRLPIMISHIVRSLYELWRPNRTRA